MHYKKTFLLQPTLLFTASIVILLIAIIIGCKLDLKLHSNTQIERGVSGVVLGCLIASCIVLGIYAIATPPAQNAIYNTKHATVSKVVHVNGTDNYIAYTKNGQKYNLDKSKVKIKTSDKASATLIYPKAKPELSQELVQAYTNKKGKPSNKLAVNLTPNMKNTKTEEWSFK